MTNNSSEYNVISDVDSTLIDFIANRFKKNDESDPLLTKDNISLSSPDEVGGDHVLSLFLYQITENTFEKNQGAYIEGNANLKYPPLSLSLFYMITPNPILNTEKARAILSRTLQIFNNNPVLRDPNLQGTLAGKELKIILQYLHLDDLNKLWTTISRSKPYRASIFYEVTPVRIESKSVEVTRVKEMKVRMFTEGA